MLVGSSVTALSASSFSTLFTRQLDVPTLSESAMTNATGVVSILLAPTTLSDPATGHPFTTESGQIVASTTSMLDHEWTIGHGPTFSSPTAASYWEVVHGPVVPKPTSSMSFLQVSTKAAPPPASTLTTVVRRSPAVLNTSEVPHRDLSTREFLENILGCHINDDDWIYFTLMKPDDSLAISPKENGVLYFVSTEWMLTYPDKVRRAIFSDPSSYPTCPEGHCRSVLIPGTDLRLSLVKSPMMYRSRGYGASCGYVDDVVTIRQDLVTRAKIGCLNNGVAMNDAVVAFVEQQVLTTYPVLEVGLILALMVGVFVVFVFRFRVCLYYCIHHFIEVLVVKSKGCGKAVAAGVYAGVDNVRNMLAKRAGEKKEVLDPIAQLPDPLHQDRGYAAVPPPAYSSA